MESIVDPITDASPGEIPLDPSPLVRVLTQVRFPMVAAIGKQDFVGPFQEAIRKEYPVLRPEQAQKIQLSPEAAPLVQTQTVWRFSDVKSQWRVSLAPDFLALETTTYASRSDFIRRLKIVVGALEEHVAPALVDRLGIRFVNRIKGNEVNDIAKLMRPEICGIVGVLSDRHMKHVLNEGLFRIDKNQLLARWGILPPQMTIDPTAIEPIEERSWILDLDMFTTEAFEFNTDRIVNDVRSFSERIYTFFRWAVTDEFMRRKEGKV